MDGVERKGIGLEDFHEDILGKAMRGLSVGKGEMASRLKVGKSEVEAVLSGALNEILIAGMAEELGLGKSKLLVSARKEWYPAPLEIECLKQFNLPFGSMFVNAFILWCEETAKAWVFDTGPEARRSWSSLPKRICPSMPFFLPTHMVTISPVSRN